MLPLALSPAETPTGWHPTSIETIASMPPDSSAARQGATVVNPAVQSLI